MTEWKADRTFLDYLVNNCPIPYRGLVEMALLLEEDQEEKRRRSRQYSFEDFLEEMRVGTPFGQKAYDRLYKVSDGLYQR